MAFSCYNIEHHGWRWHLGVKHFTVEQRFWQKVDRHSPNECWNWTARRHRNGYGSLYIDGKEILAHRISFMLNVGPIPDGLCVLHHCDNRKCVNPSHLFLGTKQDNTIDMTQKGRNVFSTGHQYATGKNNSHTHLEDKDVLYLRQNYNDKSIYEWVNLYGVSISTIARIANGRGWKHLPGAVKKTRHIESHPRAKRQKRI